MRIRLQIVAVALVLCAVVAGTSTSLLAQWRGTPAAAWAGTGKVPPPTSELAAKGDVSSVVFKWMWYMGMLRGVQELDTVATFELRKASGTLRVDGQPCKTDDYRHSINYQVGGMRQQVTCAMPNGQKRTVITVVSGHLRGRTPDKYVASPQFGAGWFVGAASDIHSWDEDVLGAGLEPGKGTPKPMPEARNNRLIRLWMSPWGAPKSVLMDKNAKVAMEGGKPVITFAVPYVPGAVAKATLNADNQAERIEVRLGNSVTEFTYEKYDDWNPEDDKIQCYTPGHIVEKKDGVTVLDVTVAETHCGNLYIVMPVPETIRAATKG